MRVLHFAPGERLAPFVRSFTVVETRVETTRTLIPDTGIVVGFRYSGSARQIEDGGPVRLPDTTLAGLRDTARRMCTSADGGVLLATFREGGAAAFFDEPLHELFGSTVSLGDLVPASELERTASRIVDGRDHAARMAVFEELLLARMRPRSGDRLVAEAVRAIRAAGGSIRIGEVARRLEISRDRLEKRFRHVVGTTPKQLASIHRLRRAVELHRSGTTLAQLAVDAGYFDQSHFIREFRAFTGEAPGRFFHAREHC